MRNNADDRALHAEMNFFGPSTYDKLTERREMTPYEIAIVFMSIVIQRASYASPRKKAGLQWFQRSSRPRDCVRSGWRYPT
jgi:hypothetical protein